MLETVIWWTGACVLSAGAALGALALLAVLVIGAGLLAGYCGRKTWNIGANLYFMHEWRRAGCPRWYLEDGKMTQMKPHREPV
jgi:hypothetical protein